MNPFFVVIILIVLVFAVIFLFYISKDSTSTSKQEKTRIKKEIYSLQTSGNSEITSIRRDSIIQSDSLLSKAMQIKLHNSDSMGNNLKLLKNSFDKTLYNKIWEAHKKRNQLVHENEDISKEETKRHLNTFKQAVNKLL